VKKIRVVSFFFFFMCCAVAVFAVKAKDVPPWMEDIEESGRSTYLIPKGAKRKIVGSQVIVEAPNEYVARRLYEMEGYLQRRFKKIEENQEKFRKDLEALKKSIGKPEKDNKLGQDLKELKSIVDELSEFKRIMEEPEPSEELVGEPDENEEIIEGSDEIDAELEELLKEEELP